jgi:hypothetical protein
MSRQEHMQWCKDRALAYVGKDNQEACNSMLSDLGKHDGTAPSQQMGFMLMMTVNRLDDQAVREFINGFG